MKKPLIAAAVILVVGALAITFRVTLENQIYGELEADIVPTISEVGGKLLELQVSLGQRVTEGEVLAVLDSASHENTVKQLEIELERAMLTLGEATGGSGSASGNALLTAQAGYNSANVLAQKSQSDYQKSIVLYEQGAITKDDLDKSRIAAQTSSDSLTSAKVKLSDASSKYTSENAQLSATKVELQLSEARRQLEKYTLVSKESGTVMSINFTEGSMISSGYDIVDISSDTQRYLVAYIPTSKLNKLEYGQSLSVDYNGKKYKGVVKYLDVKSEYEPKNLKASGQKIRKSVKIKLLMPLECPMKPGERGSFSL